MSRKTANKLTKQMLLDWGFTRVTWLGDYPNMQDKVSQEDNGYAEWWIDRKWHKCGISKTQRNVRVKVTYAVAKHKYGKTKYYPKVTFSVECRPVSISLARFLYAWFYGEVPGGMVVDHIDNNPFNNSLDNLQLLTYEENVAKRFVDNPENAHNQWKFIQKD